MKTLFIFFVLAIEIILLGNVRAYVQDTPILFLTFLQKEDYKRAYEMQDEKMKTLLPQDTLQKMWEGMQKDLGELLAFHTKTTAEKDGYTITTIQCQFEKNVLFAQVALDREGKIAGLYFSPASLEGYSPPPYAQREQFTEHEITFGLPGWKLPGTITIPQGVGPFPALLLVHGSGPNDRDETVLAHKPFKDLAWGLATKGIAVLRYDKRTHVYGLKISTSEDITQFTVETEVIIDALQALQFLRQHPHIDPQKIFLLGHSLGGYLAPEIALRDGKLRGIILCAAPARPLHQLLPEQMEYLFSLDGYMNPEEKQKLERVKEIVHKLDRRELSPTESLLDLGGYAAYFYSLLELSPLKTIAKLSLPILLIQGGRDFQVETKDFTLWQESFKSLPQASIRFYPSLNHLLSPGEGPSTPEEYGIPNHVDETLIEELASWIQEKSS